MSERTKADNKAAMAEHLIGQYAAKAASELAAPDGSVAAFNKNTCPGCGGPGRKYAEEYDYHCPNSWCDVRLFRPRSQRSRGEPLNVKVSDGSEPFAAPLG